MATEGGNGYWFCDTCHVEHGLQYDAIHCCQKKYIKPSYKLETEMMFMFDHIKDIHSQMGCRQCSTCHGCR